MRIRMLCVVSCVAAGMAASPVHAQPELVIDDFTNSPYRKVLADHPSFLTDYQTSPTIYGGVRQTSFTVSPALPSLGQRTKLQIRRNGPLVISAIPPPPPEAVD